MTDAERWLFRNVPYYLAWYRVLQFWNSADRMYPAFRVDPDWPDQTLRSAGRTTSCAGS